MSKDTNIFLASVIYQSRELVSKSGQDAAICEPAPSAQAPIKMSLVQASVHALTVLTTHKCEQAR